MDFSTEKHTSLRAYKAAFTCLYNNVERFLVHSIMYNTMVKIEEFNQKMDDQYKKLEEATDALVAVVPDEHEALYEALAVDGVCLSDILDKLANHAKLMEDNAAASALDTSVLSTSGSYAVEKFLKPFILTKDHTPQDLRLWINQFDQYYHSGNLHLHPLKKQHAFFEHCIDNHLLRNIMQYIMPETKVLGPDGCVSILEAHFRKMYPIFNQCLDLFRAAPTASKHAEQFCNHLVEMASEANIDQLNHDEIIIFIFLTCFPDEKIRELVRGHLTTKLEDLRSIIEQRMRHLQGEEAINASRMVSIVANAMPQPYTPWRVSLPRPPSTLSPQPRSRPLSRNVTSLPAQTTHANASHRRPNAI